MPIWTRNLSITEIFVFMRATATQGRAQIGVKTVPKALSTSYWKQKIAIMLQTQVSKHVLYAIYDQPFRSNQSTPSTQDSYYHDLYPDSQVSVWDIVQNFENIFDC